MRTGISSDEVKLANPTQGGLGLIPLKSTNA